MIKFENIPKTNSEKWFSLNKISGEVWKAVPGYEELLMVSNYARVFNRLQNKVMRQTVDRQGYLRVAVRMDGKFKHFAVHRLVLLAFVDNPEKKLCADHIDTNKLNNTLENLRWATHKENANNPLTKKHRKESHVHTIFSDKKVAMYDKEWNLVKIYSSITDAAKDNGIKKPSISNAAHGKAKTAAGYKWKFI